MGFESTEAVVARIHEEGSSKISGVVVVLAMDQQGNWFARWNGPAAIQLGLLELAKQSILNASMKSAIGGQDKPA